MPNQSEACDRTSSDIPMESAHVTVCGVTGIRRGGKHRDNDAEVT
jgi:hypothetical protein